jgi:hypothetical protein
MPFMAKEQHERLKRVSLREQGIPRQWRGKIQFGRPRIYFVDTVRWSDTSLFLVYALLGRLTALFAVKRLLAMEIDAP